MKKTTDADAVKTLSIDKQVDVEINRIANVDAFNDSRYTSNIVSLEGTAFESGMLIASLAFNSFDTSLGVIELFKLSNDQKKQAKNARLDRWELLKTKTDSRKVPNLADSELMATDKGTTLKILAADELAEFERLYVIDGQLIVPDLGIVSGNRRTLLVTPANALRITLKRDPMDTLPCIVREFETELDRVSACIAGNMAHKVGKKELSVIDILFASLKLIKLDGTESSLKKLGLNRNTQQKNYALCKLQLAYGTKFDIFTEIVNKDNTLLTYAKVNKESVRKLARDPKTGRIAGITAVREYLSDPVKADKEGKENDPQQMPKKAIKEWAEMSALDTAKDVFKAVEINDLSLLFKYNEKSEVINKAVENILAGQTFKFDGFKIIAD